MQALSAGRHDLYDEENQRQLPTAFPACDLPRTPSIQEIVRSDSQQDHANAEKGHVDNEPSIVDGVEETPCPSPPVPAGLVGGQKNVFWVFKRVKPRTPFTIMGQIKYIVLHSGLVNLFFACCPVGLVLYHTSGKSTASFVLNFLATIPANYLGNLAMTEIGLRVERLIADWLSMTTG